MNIEIREYTEADWSDVCQVHDRSRPYEVMNCMPAELVNPMKDEAEDDLFFASKTFVACLESAIVAFISILEDKITWLYVDPDYHRLGIASRLVEHIKPLIGKNGSVGCIKENLPALQFYEKMGFRKAAIFPGWIQDDYRCTVIRLAFPGSKYQDIPPKPCKKSLKLAGYDENNWGQAVRDANGVWQWK